MRKLFIIAFSLVVFSIAGCLKDTPGTDLSHEGTIIELMYPAAAGDAGVGTGLEFFSGCTLLFPPTDVSDTLTFYVNIAGTNTLSKAVSVTISVDNTALNDNIGNDGITYTAMPDSDYSILKTTGTIAAGQRIDTFQIVVYPSKIDLTQNFGLPITVSIPGYTTSGNFGIMYLHTIGNPIAGTYNWNWTRWNNTDSTGPTSGGGTGLTALFAPDNGTQVEVPSGYYIQPRYVITFSNNGGVLSNFAVTLNAADVATMKANGVTITTPPIIITADPVNGVYEFFYQAATPNPRTVIDVYTK
jgi:hypothetical protein